MVAVCSMRQAGYSPLADVFELGEALDCLFGRARQDELALLVTYLLHRDRHQLPPEAEETPDRQDGIRQLVGQGDTYVTATWADWLQEEPCALVDLRTPYGCGILRLILLLAARRLGLCAT